jgi:hypothetical protein
MASVLAIQTLGKSIGNVTSYLKILNSLEIIRLDRLLISLLEFRFPIRYCYLPTVMALVGKNKHNFDQDSLQISLSFKDNGMVVFVNNPVDQNIHLEQQLNTVKQHLKKG